MRIRGRSQSVSHRFDRVLRILETWGYVDGWRLTDGGRRLAGFFHESDLLVVEALRQGHLDGLPPAELAGLASVFSYEHRSPEAPSMPWFPSREVRKRWEAIESLARSCAAAEEEAGVPATRAPDPTFVPFAHAWAAGQSFASVIEDEDLSGGDFVRTMKQLIDLLRQLAILAPQEGTRASAQEAADRLFRGVVAASTALSLDDEAEDAAGTTAPAGDAPPAGGVGRSAGGVGRSARRRAVGRRRRALERVVTIRKGQEWGRRAARPPGLVEVEDDAAAGVLINGRRRAGEALPPIGLLGGDLRRTLGGRGSVAGLQDEVAMLTVDLGVVELDGRPLWFLSHLVARRSWWRGEVVAVMNAQFLGPWDVAPRGHPNDGRLDLVRTEDMGLADRWKAWRRLPGGTHVPHPAIEVASLTARSISLSRALTVRLDGLVVGEADVLEVRVEPDALTVCV